MTIRKRKLNPQSLPETLAYLTLVGEFLGYIGADKREIARAAIHSARSLLQSQADLIRELEAALEIQSLPPGEGGGGVSQP